MLLCTKKMIFCKIVTKSGLHCTYFSGGVRLGERGQDRGLERDRDRLDSRDSGHQSSGSAGSSATLRSVGDWSEHTSSSGKKYYYNCVSEVSRKSNYYPLHPPWLPMQFVVLTVRVLNNSKHSEKIVFLLCNLLNILPNIFQYL